MTDRETFDVDLAWRNLVIAGEQARIDQVLDEIDTRLVPDWVRNMDREHDLRMRDEALARSRCYIRHLSGRDVFLWLLRRSDRRLDGGVVEPTVHTRYHEDIAESILSFRQRVLEPAAKACNVTISRNRLGPLSLVPGTVMDALWAFYDSSQFVWPPAGSAVRGWREFVISAYQNGAAFDTDELTRWLTEKGWVPAQAAELASQLLSDAALLSEYDELRQPA